MAPDTSYFTCFACDSLLLYFLEYQKNLIYILKLTCLNASYILWPYSSTLSWYVMAFFSPSSGVPVSFFPIFHTLEMFKGMYAVGQTGIKCTVRGHINCCWGTAGNIVFWSEKKKKTKKKSNQWSEILICPALCVNQSLLLRIKQIQISLNISPI